MTKLAGGDLSGFWFPFGHLLINSGYRFKDDIFHIESFQHTLSVQDVGSDDHDTYRTGKVVYTVKCQNGITYRDSYQWTQLDQYDVDPRNDVATDVVDHRCNDGFGHDACAGGWNGNWKAGPTTYNPQTLVISPNAANGGDGSRPLKLPIGRIVNKWLGRKVGYPVYYGGPNKLAVPVVLVNGLGFDYTAMGAVPQDVVGTPAWRKGLVSEYTQGSLPDVMSRAYGLVKGTDINKNGIYFLNLDPSLIYGSQTDLYLIRDRLAEFLADYAGPKPLTSDLKIDVVCHSTSCLVIRAALGLTGTPLTPSAINPADHVRRIVTVNAPHQGTGLAKSDADLRSEPMYNGLPQLMSQIANANSNNTIISGNIHLDFSKQGWDDCDGLLAAGCWVFGEIADAAKGLAELATDNNLTDFNFALKGSLLGPYSIESSWYNSELAPGQPAVRDAFVAARTDAIKAQNVFFLPWYIPGLMSEYPRRSNGSYIEILPFYSENSGSMTHGFAHGIADEIYKGECKDGISLACAAVLEFLKPNTVDKVESALLGGGDASWENGTLTLSVDPNFSGMLTGLRDGWLKNSDLLVESRSQMWSLKVPRTDDNHNIITELHPATTYGFHNAQVPEGHPRRAVLHAPLASSSQVPFFLSALSTGAPLMGRDLFCGLDPACAELLSANRPIMYAGAAVRTVLPTVQASGAIENREVTTQAVKLQGDFQFYPQNLSAGTSGVAIQDANGNNLAVVTYDPLVGTSIWKTGPNGGTAQIVQAADHRPQFTVTRSGQNVSVTLTTQGGQAKTLDLTTVSGDVLNFVTLGDGLATNPVLLIGQGTAVDAQMQTPQVAWGTVRPILEEKGQNEANQCRPWMWMTNNTSEIQKNLTATYYFTADPARHPVVEMDYPKNIAFKSINLGGNLWALQISVPELPVKKAWPQGGMQIRLHYADWTTWVKTDDPSLGSNAPQFSEKVVVRDALGRVIWGEEAAATSVTATTPVVQATLSASWADMASSGEANMVRPQVTLRNTSAVSLASGYQVSLRIAGLSGSVLPVLEGYWHPGVTSALRREANGNVVIDWTFAPTSLDPGQQTTLGQWGLHRGDWQTLNKAGLTYTVSVRNSAGTEIVSNAQVTR